MNYASKGLRAKSLYTKLYYSTICTKRLPLRIITSPRAPQITILERKFTNLFKRKKPNYYSLDEIPKDYEIVYQAPMGNYIYGSQISLVVVSFGSLVPLFGLVFSYLNNTLNFSSSFLQSPTEMAIVSSCLIVFLYLIQTVYRRYTLRIYYNEKVGDFILIMPGLLPNQVSKMECKCGEMKIIEKDTLHLLTLKGQYVVNGKRMILIEDSFQAPYYLNLMMGHYK